MVATAAAALLLPLRLVARPAALPLSQVRRAPLLSNGSIGLLGGPDEAGRRNRRAAERFRRRAALNNTVGSQRQRTKVKRRPSVHLHERPPLPPPPAGGGDHRSVRALLLLPHASIVATVRARHTERPARCRACRAERRRPCSHCLKSCSSRFSSSSTFRAGGFRIATLPVLRSCGLPVCPDREEQLMPAVAALKQRATRLLVVCLPHDCRNLAPAPPHA